MACVQEIHLLRREVEDTKKRYRDLRDGKESLVDQQVGSLWAVCRKDDFT